MAQRLIYFVAANYARGTDGRESVLCQLFGLILGEADVVNQLF